MGPKQIIRQTKADIFKQVARLVIPHVSIFSTTLSIIDF